MSLVHQDRLENDVRRWLFGIKGKKDQEPSGEPLRRVELHHLNRETNESEKICDWPITADEPSEVDVPLLVTQILDTAQADSDGFAAGIQQYVVAAFFGNDSGRGQRSVVFPMRSSTTELANDRPGEAGFMPTEAPTEKGVTAQSMRLTDTSFRLLVQGFGTIMQSQGHMIEKQGGMLERLMGRHFDLVKQSEELLDHKAQRDLEADRERVKIKNLERAFDVVAPLLPMIVNKAVGYELMPTDTNPFMEQAIQVLGSLDTKQITKILEAVEPSQAIAINGLYEMAEKYAKTNKTKQITQIAKS